MRKERGIEELKKYLFIFDEGYGTAYERYSLNRLVSKMVDKYDIAKVLEMPANGIMGIPGINSLIFSELGCEVTIAHPSKKFLDNAKKIWDAFGLDANFVKSNWINSGFNEDSFDLVWNFCAFEHEDEPKKIVHEMLRTTKAYIFIYIQNPSNPGVYFHRFLHLLQKEPWDHGDISRMNVSFVENTINELNAQVIEIGGMWPPWPALKEKVFKWRRTTGSGRGINREHTDKLRPKYEEKDLSEIINEIYSFERPSKKEQLIYSLFDIWHSIGDSKTPLLLQPLLTHLRYVIAEKRR
ncbi:MAG: class I SAM-dependent methyltransferase [Thermoplasmatales archaeon]|nr:class I SAM-dependent methyltransferase [Thermoplasmatales archaeon]